MKETINVNIGAEVFTLDIDAHAVLRGYLDQIRHHLPVNDTETMDDVELRIAEIFRERVASPMRVITLDAVHAAIDQMGAPEEFGEQIPTEPPTDAAPDTPRKLTRSRTDRSIAGICGGLSEFFNVDATLLRLITLLLILFGGLSIWVYIILWIIVPKAPETNDINNKKQ
ncbi:MAG: PspC domain-containing protein [Alistipes sp.]